MFGFMQELKDKVLAALKEIRPILQLDEGDVEFVDILPNNIVEIRLLGMCKNCPISSLTLRAGIEPTIKKYAPEVTRVEVVN